MGCALQYNQGASWGDLTNDKTAVSANYAELTEWCGTSLEPAWARACVSPPPILAMSTTDLTNRHVCGSRNIAWHLSTIFWDIFAYITVDTQIFQSAPLCDFHNSPLTRQYIVVWVLAAGWLWKLVSGSFFRGVSHRIKNRYIETSLQTSSGNRNFQLTLNKKSRQSKHLNQAKEFEEDGGVWRVILAKTT